MARTISKMVPLGSNMPHFSLLNTQTNKELSYKECVGEKGTVVIFMCNHCPFVHHVLDEIIRVSNDYTVQGIGFVAISSNDVTLYPEDSPEKMYDFAFKNNMNFPYLFDEKQEIAKLFDAACTPDFFVYDSNGKLVYRGQLDDSRPGNGIVLSGADLRSALDGILTNRPINQKQKPSIGCNIKWKNTL